MSSPRFAGASRLKTGYFVLEGLNSFSTVYFFYYFYFFMNQTYGFGNRANLLLAAINAGAVYAVGAWQAGKFAQRFGYFNALKIGFLTMLTGTALGLEVRSAVAHILIMGLVVIGMCFIWPTLEALVSEGESERGLQKALGIYNIIWSATGALSYFSGGAMLEKLGPRSLFYVPMALLAILLLLTLWLDAIHLKLTRLEPEGSPLETEDLRGGQEFVVAGASSAQASRSADTSNHPAPVFRPRPAGLETCETTGLETRPTAVATQALRTQSRYFLRMAWLANPFAYIAINTLIAVVPGVAGRLGLSTMVAGFCCSIWCFARLAAFVGLWLWGGWHYRFGWLLGSFVALIGSFAVILSAGSLYMLLLSQIVFGFAIGLIYYSSLFYSMDECDAKGEHGGIHEAAIGLGNFAGPALGAASLYFLPQYPSSGTVAVSLLLLCGLGGLLGLRRQERLAKSSQTN